MLDARMVSSLRVIPFQSTPLQNSIGYNRLRLMPSGPDAQLGHYQIQSLIGKGGMAALS